MISVGFSWRASLVHRLLGEHEPAGLCTARCLSACSVVHLLCAPVLCVTFYKRMSTPGFRRRCAVYLLVIIIISPLTPLLHPSWSLAPRTLERENQRLVSMSYLFVLKWHIYLFIYFICAEKFGNVCVSETVSPPLAVVNVPTVLLVTPVHRLIYKKGGLSGSTFSFLGSVWVGIWR